MEVQHQKRELASKLAAVELQIMSLGQLTESDMVAKVEAKASKLRHTNEDLCKKFEVLQMSQFSEVEELVYLRWVNSCLRYELHNSSKTPAKISVVDLKDDLSQDIAKQLMIKYVMHDHSVSHRKNHIDNDLESLSSYSSNTSKITELDDVSTKAFPGRFNTSNKSGLIQKLKKWATSSDDSQLIHGEYLSEKSGEKGHSGMTSPRQRHSISGPKESIEHLML